MTHPALHPILCLLPGNQNTCWIFLWNLAHFPKVMRADSYFHQVVSGSCPRHLTMFSLLCWPESLSPSLPWICLSLCPGFTFLVSPLFSSDPSQRASWNLHPKHCSKLEFDEHIITMYFPPQMGNKEHLPFIKAPVLCLETIHLHLCSTQHWFTSSL